MLHSQAFVEVAKALVHAQAEFGVATKDSTNPHFKSRYADLASVRAACMPALVKHGLGVLQTIEDQDDAGLTIRTTVLHLSGEWLAGTLRLPLAQPSVQAIGSAITYGRRYGWATLLGIVADDDDDGTAAQQAAPAQMRARAPEELVLPGKAKAWGGHAGKLLQDVPPSVLRKFIDWCLNTDGDLAAKYEPEIARASELIEAAVAKAAQDKAADNANPQAFTELPESLRDNTRDDDHGTFALTSK